MFRYVAQPFHARGFKSDVRIEATGDGAMDYGLLLFLKQSYELLLGADVPLYFSIIVVEETDDSSLFMVRGDTKWDFPSSEIPPNPIDQFALHLMLGVKKGTNVRERIAV